MNSLNHDNRSARQGKVPCVGGLRIALMLVMLASAPAGWAGWVGMAIRPPAGAEIEEVAPGGPASQAGLQPGDQVLSVNGLAITSVAQLTGLIGNLPVGMPAVIKFWRYGEAFETRIIPGNPPGNIHQESPYASTQTHARANPVWLGIVVKPDSQGLRIQDVALESPAHRAGLRRNDLLLRINGLNAPTPEVLNTLISRQYPGAPVSLDILRDGQAMSMKVDLVVRPEGK